jgi:hypothetical protein
MLAALICSVRTPSRRLTLGIRFERFLADFTALLDRFVAMVISSFDLELPLSTCLALVAPF